MLKTQVEFEHVYNVTLPQNNITHFSFSSDYSDPAANKVWHSIKLNNNTKMPWTTGTAMVVKKENGTYRPISQDMMTYTPVGSNTFLKITVSPDISVKEKEKEINRIEKDKRNYGIYYDLVTIEGNIVMKNFKDKEIMLNIKKDITGTLKNSDIKWEYTKYPNNYYYDNINPMNNVSWEIKLKAGEEKNIKYTYTVYVRQ